MPPEKENENCISNISVGGNPGENRVRYRLRGLGGSYKAAGFRYYRVKQKLLKYRLEVLKHCKVYDLTKVTLASG